MHRILQAALLALAVPPSMVSAMPEIAFEDPAMKGSLVESDRPRIPAIYRGAWADALSNCYAASDRGLQLYVFVNGIGRYRASRVQGYSDHPAIVVTLKTGMKRPELAYVDISLDQQYIRFSEKFDQEPRLLQRCPPAHDGSAYAIMAEARLSEDAAAACHSEDFDVFFEAFLASQSVRNRYLAKHIRLVDVKGIRKIVKQQYQQVPIAMLDDHFVVNDDSTNPEKLEIEVARLTNGSYRVDWSRVAFKDREKGSSPNAIVQDSGSPGWLIFNRVGRCWQLVEDGKGLPDDR